MTEVQRIAAAEAICGFSERMTELYALDAREDFVDVFVPQQRRSS
ncbi:hypothetical protein ABZ917_17950 [Nonomuraea wenchangensis]